MSRTAIIRSILIALLVLGACAGVILLSRAYTIMILSQGSRLGAFPTAEEGMRALAAKTFPEEEDIQILYAGPNARDGSFPFIWYVIAEVRTPLTPGERVHCQAPGSFFLQTRQGWVHVSEGAFPEIVGFWMRIFGLAGPGQREPAVNWVPDQPKRFCQSS